MEYKKEFEYLSKYWYNDGLKKARIRDLSGAILSLEKSLLLNKKNIDVRNLLGLCYYGQGEIAKALLQWIISKNFKAHGNIAEYYVAVIEKNAVSLKRIDGAIKNYNKCLLCCKKGNYDMAILQLRKVLEVHNGFLKGWQLLGLLYIKTNQKDKAQKALKRAKQIDISNPITIKYLDEIGRTFREKPKKKKKESLSYTIGNETIIEPLPPLEESDASATFFNILIGFLVGVSVVWFLIIPAVNAVKGQKESRDKVAYSQEIAAQKAQNSALKKELKSYRFAEASRQEEDKKQGKARDSYEALLSLQNIYQSGNYKISDIAAKLDDIESSNLGAEGLSLYSRLKDALTPQICNMHYNNAAKAYRDGDVDGEIKELEKVISINDEYGKGEALMALGDAYIANNDKENYMRIYQIVLDKFPNTWYAKRAIEGQKGNPTGVFGPPLENVQNNKNDESQNDESQNDESQNDESQNEQNNNIEINQ